MIMMPIALKTLKESQTQERGAWRFFFGTINFWPYCSHFFQPETEKAISCSHSCWPLIFKREKWGRRGGVLAGPILFSDFFLVHSSMKVCMYTMHNFAFLEAIGPSIKSISHVFCLFLLVIICNTDQMICFHATLKSFFCQKQIFDNNRCVHYFEREKMSLCVYNPYNLSFAVVVQKVTKVKA